MIWKKFTIKTDNNIWIKNQKRVDVSVKDTYNHDAYHLCGSDPKLNGEIGYVRKTLNYPLNEAIVRPFKEGVQVFLVEIMILGKVKYVWNVELIPGWK